MSKSEVDVENLSFEERLRSGGKAPKWKKPRIEIKRANKNRPREMSSKIRPRREVAKPTSSGARDPRFDSLCGEFNEKSFKDSYAFLEDIKRGEEEALREQVQVEKNPKKKSQIQALLKKYKDRALEKERIKKKKMKEAEHAEKVRQSLTEGKPARFRNKAEKQVSDLVDKYEELKSKGKIENYLKKKSKKIKHKNRFEDAEFQ